MVFSSFMFLFVFLPVVLCVYQFVPDRYRNHVLLASSLVFYAWGGPRYVLLIAFEALVSWGTARLIEQSEEQGTKRLWLIVDLVALLGLLAYFKYWGFLVGSIQALLHSSADIFTPVLPIGISFYTFQLISYVVDVYRGKVHAQRAYWKLLLYCSLFHQCIAGPIVRYETVADEIDNRRATPGDVYAGVRRCGRGNPRSPAPARLVAGYAGLYAADLPRLLGVLRHGHWSRTHGGLPLS